MVVVKVRLHCRNLKGQSIQVVRSLQATQKAKTIQFKTLDGVITKERYVFFYGQMFSVI